jgi:UDP-2,3-diacylglucosamine pyrophosphatase LpxH
MHTTATGRRLLVMHGHEFDMVTTQARWLAHLGDVAYTLLLQANRPVNSLRNRFGLGYWSMSAYVKSRVKNAVCFISQFEEAVVRYARMSRADGIVCGHIHTPTIRDIGGLAYYNCGDWVENHSALVEHSDGRIQLLRWPQFNASEEAAAFPFESLDMTDSSEWVLTEAAGNR